MTDRRQDIQVLRAFAVSIVIVFHLNESYLPLGYLGVDVFFVISGFVITRGILARTVSGEAFSASAFLARRVMRLLPALLLTVVATFVLGFLIYSPEQLAMLSLSSMHAVAGLSNIFFFFQTDYFSAPLETMPLLHTWSLSVEEQFYLLFAFVAWVLAATRVNFTAGLLIVWSLAVLASLALNTTDLRFLADYSALSELNDPGSAFHFFMLPSRVYQIGLGVVAACFLARHKRLSLGHEVRLGLYALAATLLCLLIVFGLEHRLLPVAVCLLTVSLLLLGEGEAEFGGHRILALPRYLGDRSYSLYLVHWPIVVFYSYATSQEVTLGTSIGLVAVTLALGEISFQVAERRSLFAPGRRENKATVHPALVYSLLGFSSLMITVQNLDGMPSRLQSKVAEAAESEEQTWRLVEKFKPIAGYGRTQTIVPTETPIRYRVLVLGDSHAGQLKGMGTYFSMKYGVEWTTYSGGGCPPVFEYYRIYSVSRVSPLHRQERCRKLASSWRLFIEQNNAAFDLVILSSRWNQIFDHDKYLGKPYRNDALVPVSVDHEELVQQYAREPEQVMLQSQNNLIAGLKDTVQYLDDNNMGVFVFSQVPLNRADADFCGGVPDYFFDNADVDERCAGPLREAVLKRGEFMETLVRSSALNPATGVVVSDAFCAEDAERCIYMHEGASLFKDDNHLNPVGAQFLARWWEAQSGFPF